jgi:hypothetical protein
MASGDITLTVPKSIPNLPLGEVDIGILPAPAFVRFAFFEIDATGPVHVVTITNTQVTGFGYAAGVFTDGVDRGMSGYLTTILGVLFVGNATTLNQRKTATVQRLITDGVITLAGSVA